MSFETVMTSLDKKLREMGFIRLVSPVNKDMIREYVNPFLYVGVSYVQLLSPWTWDGMVLQMWVRVDKSTRYNDAVYALSVLDEAFKGVIPYLTVTDDLSARGCVGEYRRGSRDSEAPFVGLYVSHPK